MRGRAVRLTHRASGTVLAEAPLGWGITPFEGAYYVGRRHLKTRALRPNFTPGLCFYKFLYVWLDLRLDGHEARYLGWYYWLPNPLLPFIAWRVALPQAHPELEVAEYDTEGAR